MASEKSYSVWMTNPRRGRWKWLVIPAAVFIAPITTVALGVLLDYIFGRVAAVIGVLIGISIWLWLSWWYGRWARDMATVTVESDKLVAVKQHVFEREELLFSELVKYRVLTSFRGNASLQLIAKNGRQLALGGDASPEFTSLIKEFDAAVLHYERLSRRSITRIDMG